MHLCVPALHSCGHTSVSHQEWARGKGFLTFRRRRVRYRTVIGEFDMAGVAQCMYTEQTTREE